MALNKPSSLRIVKRLRTAKKLMAESNKVTVFKITTTINGSLFFEYEVYFEKHTSYPGTLRYNQSATLINKQKGLRVD